MVLILKYNLLQIFSHKSELVSGWVILSYNNKIFCRVFIPSKKLLFYYSKNI